MNTAERLEKKYNMPKDTLAVIAEDLEDLNSLKMSDEDIMGAIRGGMVYAKTKNVNFIVAFSTYTAILRNNKTAVKA